MDSYSGRFPLDFISFYLGMTTEAQETTTLVPESEPHEETSPAGSVGVNPTGELRPSSNFSSSSEATEESLSTYAEMTMIAREDAGAPKISSLLPPLTEQTAETTEAVVPGLRSSGECSGAGPITPQISGTPQVIAVDQTPHEQTEQDDVSVVSISAVNRTLDPSKYYTDTREIEDLMDSSGVGGPVTPKAKVTSTFVKVPALGTESTSEDESSHDQAGTSNAQHVTPHNSPLVAEHCCGSISLKRTRLHFPGISLS